MSIPRGDFTFPLEVIFFPFPFINSNSSLGGSVKGSNLEASDGRFEERGSFFDNSSTDTLDQERYPLRSKNLNFGLICLKFNDLVATCNEIAP